MTDLPPLTHPDGFHLTPAQQATLEALPDNCKVVASDGTSPLIRRPHGHLIALPPDGQPRRATDYQRKCAGDRVIDLLFPKLAAA